MNYLIDLHNFMVMLGDHQAVKGFVFCLFVSSFIVAMNLGSGKNGLSNNN